MGALSLDDRCQVFAEEIAAVTLLDAPALLAAFGRVRPRILGAPATPPEGDHGRPSISGSGSGSSSWHEPSRTMARRLKPRTYVPAWPAHGPGPMASTSTSSQRR